MGRYTKILDWITQQRSNYADVGSQIKDFNVAINVINKFVNSNNIKRKIIWILYKKFLKLKILIQRKDNQNVGTTQGCELLSESHPEFSQKTRVNKN